MPSVLPACNEEPATCSESPLSFTFCLSLADNSKVNYVPRGIFPHLIVHIEGQGYEIQENTLYESCLFRDFATFGIEPSPSNKMQYAYNVMVGDKMDHVTIAIDPAQEDKLSTADCRRIVICSESSLSFTFCLTLGKNKKVHFVPCGIFPHLVVHIEGRGYVIVENMKCKNYLFRDVAFFSIEPSRFNKMQYAYNVMVGDKMNHVTISIDPARESKEKSSPADCRQIVSDFKHAMAATYTRIYHSSLEVTLASECRCSRPGTPASHLAMIHCQGGHCEMQCLLPLLPFRYDCPPKLAELLCIQGNYALPFYRL